MTHLYKEAVVYPAIKYLLKGLQAGPIGQAVNKTLAPGVRWLEARTDRYALDRLQHALQGATPSFHPGAIQLPGGQNVSIRALQDLGLHLPVKTAKAHRLSRRMTFRGLQISIETDKGEKRHWHDPHAHTNGVTLMKHPYGYIRRTEGVDGDHVDVYVGPNEEAENVYVVHQMKAPDFKKFDEDKCMLGFDTLDEAKKAYLAHYTDSRFLGSITTMPFEEFKEKVMKTYDHPKKIAEAVALVKEGLMRGIHKVPGAVEKLLPQIERTVTRAGTTAGKASTGPAASRMFDDVMQEARRSGSAQATRDLGMVHGPWG